MPDPQYMGGQAVMEGVMMRGPRTWAVAVRTPDDEIELMVHDAPTWARSGRRSRSCAACSSLGESLSLGFKALAWSADRQLPEEERISPKAMGWTMGISLVFFAAIFLVLPALGTNALGNSLGVEGFWYHLLEGARPPRRSSWAICC